MQSKFVWLTVLTLTLFGAGCAWFSRNPSIVPAGPRPADFTGASPAEAAKKVNFVPGSQIEIRQTYLGVGAKLDDKQAGDNKEGVRIVTLERFAPMVYANLSWKLSRRVEGSASTTEMQTVKGKMTGIELKQNHQLYLPGYWPSEALNVSNLSAIWLSEDVYNALSKNKLAGINFGILDTSLYGALNTSKVFSEAIKSLQDQVGQAELKEDLDVTRAEETFSDWTLNINGQDVKVQVIKAKSWFGEIVVLNNPQNPLILKMTFDPAIPDAASKIKNYDLLKTLLGYEVTRLDNVQ
ncbi:MAG: hypothetical protein PHC70_03835 [Patescibacteria group bacterium]|nr:hypothetical protein [Patescibacteria group bacterium]